MTNSEPKKRKRFLILAGAAVLALALAGLFVWLGFYLRVYPIDLNEYVQVVFEGYDGAGKAEVKVDREAFLEKYQGKLRWKDRADRKRGDAAEALMDSVEALLRESEELQNGWLSNGNELLIRWQNKNFANRIANAEVSAESFHVKTEGLKEPGSFDAFAALEVVFEGLDGEGAAVKTVEHSGLKYKYNLDYKIVDKKDELSNGDTVTVSIGGAEKEREIIRDYGMKPLEMTKAFTVEGLITYTTFDPFDSLVVTFGGKNGEGRVRDFYMASSDPARNHLSFTYDRTGGLKNGDPFTVTVIFGMNDRENMAGEYGMIPEPLEKVYIVSGLTEGEDPGPQGGGEEGDDEMEKVFGNVDGNLYTNEFFKLKAQLPSEFTLYGKGNISSDVIGGLNDLYAPAKDTDNIGVRILELSEEEKALSAKEILESYSKEILRIYESYGLKINYTFRETNFAGEEYTLMDITAELRVIVVVKRIRHRIFVRKDGDFAIAVSVMAGDDKTLERYCSYFEKLE